MFLVNTGNHHVESLFLLPTYLKESCHLFIVYVGSFLHSAIQAPPFPSPLSVHIDIGVNPLEPTVVVT